MGKFGIWDYLNTEFDVSSTLELIKSCLRALLRR